MSVAEQILYGIADALALADDAIVAAKNALEGQE